MRSSCNLSRPGVPGHYGIAASRRRGEACLALLILLLAPACKRREKIRVQQTEEDTGQLSSVIHTADPKAAAQLLKGFHSIEQNAWRWTMAKFAIVLRPPKNAQQRGATLSLKFSIPDPVIERLKTVSLSATIGGIALAPESYTQPGEFTYTREIEGRVLAGEAVNIEFTLDKAIPPGEVDQRELGIVVSSVGLEAK
jgi:hypothetical protein